MDSILVFSRTRIRADRLSRHLASRGVKVGALHGDKTQLEREDALREFRSGRFAVLVATDVASRGLDVEGISHVINYDVPHATDDYIHRVGRTARAEHLGDAVTLCSPEEKRQLRAIEQAIGSAIPVHTLPGFDAFERQPSGFGRRDGGGRRGRRPQQGRHGR